MVAGKFKLQVAAYTCEEKEKKRGEREREREGRKRREIRRERERDAASSRAPSRLADRKASSQGDFQQAIHRGPGGPTEPGRKRIGDRRGGAVLGSLWSLKCRIFRETL